MSDLQLNKRWSKKWDSITWNPATNTATSETGTHTTNTTETTINVSGNYIENQINNYSYGSNDSSGQDKKPLEILQPKEPIKNTISNNGLQKRLPKKPNLSFDKNTDSGSQSHSNSDSGSHSQNLISETISLQPTKEESHIATKWGHNGHTQISENYSVALGIIVGTIIGFIIQKVASKAMLNNTVQTPLTDQPAITDGV